MNELKNEKKVVQHQIFHASLFTFHFFVVPLQPTFESYTLLL